MEIFTFDFQGEISRLSSQITQNIAHGDITIIDFGTYPLSEVEVALSELEASLGSIIVHKHANKWHSNKLTPVSAKGYYADDKRPQSSSSVQSPHTDGGINDRVPRAIALHCVSTAAIGGESTFVSVGDIWTNVQAQFGQDEIESCFKERAYTLVRGDKHRSRPLFTRAGDLITMSFSYHEFADNGKDTRVIVSSDCSEIFNFIAEFVKDERNQLCLALKDGQCLFVSNLLSLHGRKAWTDSEKRSRFLLRCWYS